MGFPILNPLRPEYITKTFSQIWDSYDKFKEDYDAYAVLMTNNIAPFKDVNNARATYYLLYARYGNNPIANNAIQKTLRDLSEADLIQGAKQIYNHAFNPSTAPSTNDLEELTFINDQNVSNNKKAKMEAYSILWTNLHVDATDEYLNKFKDCFSRFVGDQKPILFVEED